MNTNQRINSLITDSLAYLLIVAPAILCLQYVNCFGVNLPFWDEWQFVDLLKSVYAGTASWLDVLCKQSGEHIVGIPYLLMIWLANCTHYNVRAEMFLGWVFLALTLILVLKIARDRLPRGSAYTIALLPISWLVCSLRQYETLLWGFQIQTTISIFFFVLAIYLLDRTNEHSPVFLGLAALSGMLSTFSFGNGLLIWPLGALQLLLKKLWGVDSEKSAKPLVVWLIASSIAGLICFCCYKNAYLGNNPYGLTLTMWLNNYQAVVSFFIAYLVSPVIATVNDHVSNSHPDIVVAPGLVICGIYLAVIVFAFRQSKDLKQKLPAPLVLILYAIMSDCLTVLARVGGGVNQALASRYTSISCLGIVGVYLMLLIINKPSLKVRAFLLGALLMPVFTSVIMCTEVGIEEGKQIRIQRILLSYVVLSYKQQDIRLLPPSLHVPENFKELAAFLEVNRLSVFRTPHPDLHIPKVVPTG